MWKKNNEKTQEKINLLAERKRVKGGKQGSRRRKEIREKGREDK